MRARVLLVAVMTSILAMSFVNSPPSFAGVTRGAACSPQSSKAIVSGKLYTCTKTGNRLSWDSGSFCPSMSATLLVNSQRFICVVSNTSRNWLLESAPIKPSLSIALNDTTVFVITTSTVAPTAPINRFQYSIDNSPTWTTTTDGASPFSISGLVPHSTHSIRVRAVNEVGTSPVTTIKSFTTRNPLTRATLRFKTPNVSATLVHEDTASERTWSVTNTWYSRGLRVFHIQNQVGSTVPITISATDQDGFPIVGKIVTLRVNKRYSNSTATFTDSNNVQLGNGSNDADGADLTATTDMSGIASFTIKNTNTESQTVNFPASLTSARGNGVPYGQIAPSMFNSEAQQIIDIAEFGFYKTAVVGMAHAPAPVLPGHQIGTLLWSQDFANGNALDTTTWTARHCGQSASNGGGTCFNNEQQYFAPSTISQSGSGGGLLSITATHFANPSDRPQDSGDCLSWSRVCNFASGRMDTQGQLYVQYGYLEARISTPVGGANWPAFWMLGKNITEQGTGWPVSGEIDIMEGKGGTPNTTTGALHYLNGAGDGDQYSAGSHDDSGGYPGTWHTYAVAWLGSSADGDHSNDMIQLLVDGQVFLTVHRNEIPHWPFNQPFFLILNNAIGDFGGTYDNWSSSTMSVDYIRYYQLDGQGSVSH